MNNKNFRIIKIIQFFILAVLELSVIFVFVTQPQIRSDILSDRCLSILFAMVWTLLIASLVFLFLDFFRLRFFEEENHSIKKKAYTDDLTSFPNRHGLDAIFQTYNEPKDLSDMGCMVIILQNLDIINKTQGRPMGDVLIRDFSAILKKVGERYGIVGRNGSNEFISIINPCNEEKMDELIRTMNQQIEEYNLIAATAPIQIKYAFILNSTEHKKTFKELISAVYAKIR